MTSHGSSPVGTDRPGMLIAMVSRDVIVLAKLVRTLCPHQVLLFGTDHARKNGWTDAATRLLTDLKGNRPEILQDFRVIDLANADLPAKLESFRRTLAQEVTRIGSAGTSVAFDCTTGQSIFHVLGFDTIRGIGANRGVEVSAVYIDADTRHIVRSTDRGDRIKYDQQPTEFRYRAGAEVAERFGVYGVVPQGGQRLWPFKGNTTDDAALCQLFDALGECEALRALFHSYWLKLKRWKQNQNLASEISGADIHAQVQLGIDGIADLVSRQTGRHSHREIVRADLSRAFAEFAPGGDAAAWLQRYLADKKLSSLNRLLQEYARVLPQSLLNGRNNGKKRDELLQTLVRQFKVFVAKIRREADHLAQSVGHDPASFSRDEHRAFREQQVRTMDVAEDVKTLLLNPDQELPDLFEACIGCAVARAVDCRFRDSVASVVQNVTFFKDDNPVAEIDTLILFRNADISILEAKTHCGNADHKKIEANIKNVRDFGGAYSTYNLVYPLNGKDIAELAEEDERQQEKWRSLGMEDAVAWRQYLKRVRQTRDQRILGLDQLDHALLAR